MKVKYIKTMDFTFEDVMVLDAIDEAELIELIEENKVIKINNNGTIEYINSNYIMFFEV